MISNAIEDRDEAVCTIQFDQEARRVMKIRRFYQIERTFERSDFEGSRDLLLHFRPLVLRCVVEFVSLVMDMTSNMCIVVVKIAVYNVIFEKLMIESEKSSVWSASPWRFW